MKIAILSAYSGVVQRGVEGWTYELASRLGKKHQVRVYRGDEKFKIQSSKFKVDEWNFKRRLFLDRGSWGVGRFTLRGWGDLWNFRPDVVIPTNGGWQSLICRVFTFLRGGKLVIVGHAGPGWDDRWNLWLRPDVWVGLTRHQSKWANRAVRGVRIETIADGVDMEKFKPGGKRLKWGLERPIFLAVGALTATKKLDLTIRAVASLKKGSLVIVGDGDLRGRIEKQGRKKLGKRFKLMEVDYSQMPQVYRSADVFTLVPWEREAFGMVYIEAMACGLSVVARDDAVRREIVGEVGILVKHPEGVGEYARALDAVAGKKWGSLPRKQAEKFSWDKVAAKYERLFLSLVK